MPPPPPRRDPIHVPAQQPPTDAANSAAIIFIHGLGDEAETFESVAAQFQSAKKLPYMRWVIPNAKENMDAMQTAWYVPSSLTPFPSSRPELEDPEDEDGMLSSREYIVSLIDQLVAEGVPVNRIVLGGFSQGGAMTLLTGFTSKYADKLAGLACICGYMPLAEKYQDLRKDVAFDAKAAAASVPVLVQRGARDMLIPKRYHTTMLTKLKELGVTADRLEAHEYEAGHTVNAQTLRDLCAWLEKVVPPVA